MRPARIQAFSPLYVASHLTCPLCQQLFHDPVTLASGQTFDLDCLVMHMGKGKLDCPLSRNQAAFPNTIIRAMLDKLPAHDDETTTIMVKPRASFEPIDLTDPNLAKAIHCETMLRELDEAETEQEQASLLDELEHETSHDKEYAKVLAQSRDGLALLIRFAKSEIYMHRRRAIACLADAAREEPLAVVETPDLLATLEALLASTEHDCIRAKAARSITSLAKHDGTRSFVLDTPGMVTSIAACLASDHDSLVKHATLALAYAAVDPDFQVSILRLHHVLPRLMHSLMDESSHVRKQALVAVQHLASHERNRELMLAHCPGLLNNLVETFQLVLGPDLEHAVATLEVLASIHTDLLVAIPDALDLLRSVEDEALKARARTMLDSIIIVIDDDE